MSEDMLSAVEVAELLSITPGRWRTLVADGVAPAPDGFGCSKAGRARNEWKRSTVEAFMRQRPGQGFRSDLRRAG